MINPFQSGNRSEPLFEEEIYGLAFYARRRRLMTQEISANFNEDASSLARTIHRMFADRRVDSHSKTDPFFASVVQRCLQNPSTTIVFGFDRLRTTWDDTKMLRKFYIENTQGQDMHDHILTTNRQ